MKEELKKKIRPWNHKIEYTFEQWCIDNNRQDILERWDYDLNDKNPSEVSYKSNKKYWFKCPRCRHESELKNIQYLPVRQKELPCVKCNIFAQHVIDEYEYEYYEILEKLNPDINLWNIAHKSQKMINIRCQINYNHIYQQRCDWFWQNGCPYCGHHTERLDVQLDPSESLGAYHSKARERWSTKNVTSPYDYYPNASDVVWWKCEYEKHEDYQRKISNSLTRDFRCPICAIENIPIVTGPDHWSWKGGLTPESKRIRSSAEYKHWRDAIFKKDNYTCQCCGKRGGKLNAHHIKPFAQHEDLRFDINNGITLCEGHHDASISGSFHNTYGTYNNTPEQLEEYINNKRKQLGIDIPFNINNYQQGDRLSPILLQQNKEA